MRSSEDCIRHHDTWMERHVAESFLLILTIFCVVSYILFDTLLIGFVVGVIVASWTLLRCLAKEVYFTTVHHIQKEVQNE